MDRRDRSAAGSRPSAGWLGERPGVVVVDADQAARDVVAPGSWRSRRSSRGWVRPSSRTGRWTRRRSGASCSRDPQRFRDLEAIAIRRSARSPRSPAPTKPTQRRPSSSRRSSWWKSGSAVQRVLVPAIPTSSASASVAPNSSRNSRCRSPAGRARRAGPPGRDTHNQHIRPPDATRAAADRALDAAVRGSAGAGPGLAGFVDVRAWSVNPPRPEALGNPIIHFRDPLDQPRRSIAYVPRQAVRGDRPPHRRWRIDDDPQEYIPGGISPTQGGEPLVTVFAEHPANSIASTRRSITSVARWLRKHPCRASRDRLRARLRRCPGPDRRHRRERAAGRPGHRRRGATRRVLAGSCSQRCAPGHAGLQARRVEQTGDQPKAIEGLIDGLAKGLDHQVLPFGVTGMTRCTLCKVIGARTAEPSCLHDDARRATVCQFRSLFLDSDKVILVHSSTTTRPRRLCPAATRKELVAQQRDRPTPGSSHPRPVRATGRGRRDRFAARPGRASRLLVESSSSCTGGQYRRDAVLRHLVNLHTQRN